jgi:hypothetical protein
MNSPLEVALSYLDALGHDDPDAVAAHVADDFHNEHQSAIGSGCTGRDAYRERLPGFMGSFPDRHYTVIETVGPSSAAGDGSADGGEQTVVVRYRLTADVDGHRIDIPGVMWFGVRDGLITRRIDTWDSLTFFRQTDQDPPPAG